MWLYDIELKDGSIVGDQGEIDFSTEEEAIDDAKNFIQNGLMEEYNMKEDNFIIKTYKANY